MRVKLPILVHSFYFDFRLVLMMSVTSNGFTVPFLDALVNPR